MSSLDQESIFSSIIIVLTKLMVVSYVINDARTRVRDTEWCLERKGIHDLSNEIGEII